MNKRLLNRSAISLLLMVVCTSLLGAQRVNERSGPAPVFQGEDVLSGETIRLEDYRGQLVLLNFWATWCGACLLELPELVDLREDYAGELEIIGIALDYSSDIVKGYLWDENVDYPVIMSTDEIERSYGGISSTPTSFLIDEEGEIVETIIGWRPYDVLADIMDGYLDEK